MLDENARDGVGRNRRVGDDFEEMITADIRCEQADGRKLGTHLDSMSNVRKGKQRRVSQQG